MVWCEDHLQIRPLQQVPVQSWPCTVPETAAGRGCKGIYDFDYTTLGTFKEAAAFPAFLAHGPLVFFDAFESAIAAA